jgi:hypothetical protein
MNSSDNKSLHRKRSFLIFPSPAGMSLTKLFLGGNNDVIYKLFSSREILVSAIPAGDGEIEKLFYGVQNGLEKLFFKVIRRRQLKKSTRVFHIFNQLVRQNCYVALCAGTEVLSKGHL